ADGTGQIEGNNLPTRPPEQFTWRVEDEGGELYLTLDTSQGPVSMRVWLQPDGRRLWEQNVFSRRTEGRRGWFNPTSGHGGGREWVSRFSAWTAFGLARDVTPTAE